MTETRPRMFPGHGYWRSRSRSAADAVSEGFPIRMPARWEKKDTNSGRSSSRSRSEGRRSGKTLIRYHRSLRKRPSDAIDCRSRCVAAMTRTSTWSVRWPPTRSSVPSWNPAAAPGRPPAALRSRRGTGSLHRPSRTSPCGWPPPPVKPPRSWPNSSSMSSVGMAPQVFDAHDRSFRAARLLVDGPGDDLLARSCLSRIRTGASVTATWVTFSITSARPPEIPTMGSMADSPTSRVRRARLSASAASRSRASSWRRRSLPRATAKGSRSLWVMARWESANGRPSRAIRTRTPSLPSGSSRGPHDPVMALAGGSPCRNGRGLQAPGPGPGPRPDRVLSSKELIECRHRLGVQIGDAFSNRQVTQGVDGGDGRQTHPLAIEPTQADHLNRELLEEHHRGDPGQRVLDLDVSARLPPDLQLHAHRRSGRALANRPSASADRALVRAQ